MHTIGIDVGATSIKIISFDKRLRGSARLGRLPQARQLRQLRELGELYRLHTSRTSEIKTPRSLPAFKAALTGVLKNFSADQARGIGAGIAAAVDPATGLVLSAHNLPFLNHLNIKKFLARFNTRVQIDNDVRCITQAEAVFGAARGVKNAVIIAVGTGIGGGIIIDGKLYRGSASAGEIGYMVLDQGQTFESLAGGRTLRTFSDAELRRVGKYVGLACANVINLLGPEIIILGGGVIERSSKKIMPAARAVIKHHSLWHAVNKTKIITSQLGSFAGAMGAALLVK